MAEVLDEFPELEVELDGEKQYYEENLLGSKHIKHACGCQRGFHLYWYYIG